MTDVAALPASFVLESLETMFPALRVSSGGCAPGLSDPSPSLYMGRAPAAFHVDHRDWQPEPAGRSGCGLWRPGDSAAASETWHGARSGRRQPSLSLLRPARMSPC
jgi:hypothetical protein